MSEDSQGVPPQVLRGLQLKELGRYADAENAFREALAQEPNDAFALHHLAACQFHQAERRTEALRTVDNAISIEPNDADHHTLRSFILSLLDRPKEALAAAQTAHQLAPYSDTAFTAEAQAYLQLEKWPEAEEAARQALAIDADNSSAANQLAQALRLQNKIAENKEHLAGLLTRDPEDPYTHANAGWMALQSGNHRQAEEHFREALRLDPEFTSAREGLLNSFRARSAIYRAYLSYCFAMQRLSAGSRWAVIIGLYFGVKVVRYVLPGPIGVAVMALYIMFVLWVWVAKPVGNMMLLFDRFARFALTQNEKVEAAVVGGGLTLGLVLLGVSFFTHSYVALLVGIGLIAQSFPLAMTFTNGSKFGRWLFGIIGGVTLVGSFLVLCSQILPFLPFEIAAYVLVVGCFGCLAATWLGNVPALRKEGV